MRRVTRGRLSAGMMAAALAGSALGAGGIHWPVLAGWSLLLLTAGLFEWWGQGRGASGQDHPSIGLRTLAPAFVFGGLACVCLAQTVPLPLAWLEVISPESTDVWTRAAMPWGVSAPDSAPISLTPGRTAVEALKMSGYGLVFGVSFLWTRRSGLRAPSQLVFGLGVLVALVTLGLSLSDAKSLYGLYHPLNVPSVAPILNANSLSGYLNVAIFSGVGLLAHTRSPKAKPLLALGLLLLIGVVFERQSRAASGLLLLGLGGWLLFPAGQRPPLWKSPQAAVLTSLILGGASFSLLASRQQGLQGLVDSSLEKLQLLRWSGEWALKQWGPGIGRGAFGSAFFVHLPSSSNNTSFDHPENLALQWGVEWGLPVALLALGVLGWSLLPLVSPRSLRHPLRRGLTFGVAILLVQNLVDLGLEIPAVASLLACGLGALCGSLKNPRAAVARAPSSHWLLAGCGLTALSLGLAWPLHSPLLTQERNRLQQILRNGEPPHAAFWQQLKVATEQFPADPYFPLLGSAVAEHADLKPLSWIALALERGPLQAVNHTQLARILHSRGATEQALGALRRAVELSTRETQIVLELSARWQLTPTQARQTVPEGPAGAALLRQLALQVNDHNLRLDWLQQAAARRGPREEEHFALANELVVHLSLGERSEQCRLDRARCETRALHHLQKGQRAGEPGADILHSKLLVAQGKPVAAERQLSEACAQYPGDPRCPATWVPLALANHSAALPQAISQWLAAGCTLPQQCAATHLALGRLLIRFGRKNQALSHFERAAREEPTPDAWQTVAELAESLGDSSAAKRARRRARRLTSRPARDRFSPPR